MAANAMRRPLGSLATRSLATLAGSASAGLPRVRVGGVPEHFNTPWHTAASKGLFAVAGLSVEWVDFPGGTGAMNEALHKGEIDVALALTEGLVTGLHRGNPSKLLGTYVASPLTWGVHVNANSSFQSMADLSGAVYAVSRMGSGSHLMACVDAHARGVAPPELEVVKSLDGARIALRDDMAHVFMWEKFTTKFLVDSGEWRRVGEVDTPWPCFSICATNEALETKSELLLAMLNVVRTEARDLRASADCAKTIGLMYAQHEVDIVEWLGGVRWCIRPVVSHATLNHVMESLVAANVLERDELLPPEQLVSHLCADEDPNVDSI